MKTGGRRAVFSDINITPLTDIFLVLLIIMMVVAPMLDSSGLKLDVPSVGPSSDTKEKPKVIDITISKQDRVSVNGSPFKGLSLANELRQLSGKFPDGVVIHPDPDSTHGVLTGTMDAAQSAGISKIGVTAN